MLKKIVFVDHTPFPGGAQLVLAEHISNIDKKEFQCVVVCSSDTPMLLDKYKEAGARVLTINFGQLKKPSPLSLLRLKQSYSELTNLLREEKPGLVVTNTVRAHLIGSLSAARLKIPLIWIIRDYTFSKKLFKLLYPITSKVLTVSSDLIKYYGLIESTKNQVIYVGTDIGESLVKVKQAEVDLLRTELGIDKKAFVVGFVGRLVDWKGAAILVKAIKELAVYPDIVGVIVGDGKGQEGSNEEEVRSLSLGFEDNIKLTGFRDPEQIPVFLKMFDCFVHPSYEPEPFATVVVSAMMAKLPVIGTNLGGTPEIITNQENGLLVTPKEPGDLANAILRLYKGAKLREILGEKGYESVKSTLTEKNVTKKVLNHYREVIG